eukprot:scaffold11454_cov168-Amphora_coffeaeformis.AAC.6
MELLEHIMCVYADYCILAGNKPEVSANLSTFPLDFNNGPKKIKQQTLEKLCLSVDQQTALVNNVSVLELDRCLLANNGCSLLEGISGCSPLCLNQVIFRQTLPFPPETLLMWLARFAQSEAVPHLFLCDGIWKALLEEPDRNEDGEYDRLFYRPQLVNWLGACLKDSKEMGWIHFPVGPTAALVDDGTELDEEESLFVEYFTDSIKLAGCE